MNETIRVLNHIQNGPFAGWTCWRHDSPDGIRHVALVLPEPNSSKATVFQYRFTEQELTEARVRLASVSMSNERARVQRDLPRQSIAVNIGGE